MIARSLARLIGGEIEPPPPQPLGMDTLRVHSALALLVSEATHTRRWGGHKPDSTRTSTPSKPCTCKWAIGLGDQNPSYSGGKAQCKGRREDACTSHG